MMKLPPRLRTRMYRWLPRRKTFLHPSKSMFYSTVLYSRYTPGIYVSNILRSTLTGPPSLPRAQGCFRPGLSAGSFFFCDKKALQFEAGAYQSSTTRYWPHRRGCPCVIIPGLQVLQHTQIRRPASGVQYTCTEWSFPRSRLPASVEFFNKASMCVLNGRGSVAIKKAQWQKEWNGPWWTDNCAPAWLHDTNLIQTQLTERCARYCPVDLKNYRVLLWGSGLEHSTRRL